MEVFQYEFIVSANKESYLAWFMSRIVFLMPVTFLHKYCEYQL